MRWLWTLLKWGVGIALGASLVAVLGLRAFDAQRGPPLEVWHTYVPDDVTAEDIARSTGRLPRRGAGSSTRCARRSPRSSRRRSGSRSTATSTAARSIRATSPTTGTAPTSWSRTARPSGAVVLLHGLTDAPYSLRHIARGLPRPRLGGHRAAAARARHRARRPDRRRLGGLAGGDAARGARGAPPRRPAKPLHLVGFSNGGALAMKYALDALEDPPLPRPDRLVLISPMIGITRFRALRRDRRLAGRVPGLRQAPPGSASCPSSTRSSTTRSRSTARASPSC